MRIDFCQLSDIILSDILLTIHLAKSSDASGISCSSTIKALRWLHRVAEVPCLSRAYNSMVSSFMVSKIPRDKKEAPPLPLYVVIQWERRILQSQSSVFEVLILGSFLFQLWSGLRFADMQRLTLASLVYDTMELRGLAWRSKTSVSGIAFGITASGFLSHGSHTWVWKFLSTLDQVLYDFDCTGVDFLLPACTLTEIQQPYAPMSYASALHFLRYFLGCPWKEAPDPMKGLDLNYIVHSLKATLLSWAPQLDVPAPPEQRLQQGHHSDGRPSMHLYSRDSVWAQLSYQRSVISQVRNKWIPKTAQHRGSQLPLREPPVVIEGFKKAIPSDFQFKWFEFEPTAPPVEPAEPPHIQETDMDGGDSSSSSSTSSSSSASESEPRRKKRVIDHSKDSNVDELLLGQYRQVMHALIQADASETWRPIHLDMRLKPACGRAMRAGSLVIVDHLDTGATFCQHPGCRKAFTRANFVV